MTETKDLAFFYSELMAELMKTKKFQRKEAMAIILKEARRPKKELKSRHDLKDQIEQALERRANTSKLR